MPAPCARALPAPLPVPARSGLTIVVLALLLSVQPVTTDLYLPALPALTRSLGASLAAAQLTLSALVLAFGCSQLVWGPLSDRFGRRPILLAGLGIYTLASLGSALAPAMAWLIGWRVAQGAAMGALVVCARAIVRDLYSPPEGARAMSQALTGLGLVACVCAPLGGLLSEWLGWRAALLALTVYALVTLALVALRLPETLALRNPQALQARALLGVWRQVLGHPTFWAFALLTTASYGGLFSFLAASSFVFIDVLGLTRTQYGGVMASACAAYLAGTLLCRRLLAHQGLPRTVAIAGGLSLCGGTLMALLAHLGWQQPWALLLPFCLFMLGHGVHQPCGQSGALGPFPRAAGVASALSGCMSMLAAFAVGGWIGLRLDGTVWPLVDAIWLCSLLLALIAWTLVQKYAGPSASPRERG